MIIKIQKGDQKGGWIKRELTFILDLMWLYFTHEQCKTTDIHTDTDTGSDSSETRMASKICWLCECATLNGDEEQWATKTTVEKKYMTKQKRNKLLYYPNYLI